MRSRVVTARPTQRSMDTSDAAGREYRLRPGKRDLHRRDGGYRDTSKRPSRAGFVQWFYARGRPRWYFQVREDRLPPLVLAGTIGYRENRGPSDPVSCQDSRARDDTRGAKVNVRR